MKTILGISLTAALLTGCAPVEAADELPPRALTGECDASGVQNHIGHRASAAAGQTLLELTGARVLRWVPPDTAVTMDYSPSRLTVSYDRNMVIERISCG